MRNFRAMRGSLPKQGNDVNLWDALWSMKTLLQNRGGVAGELGRALNTQPALVPASPWLGNRAPLQPTVTAGSDSQGLRISWLRSSQQTVWLWALQWKEGKYWRMEIPPGTQTSLRLANRKAQPSVIALRAVDRSGMLGQPAVLQRSAK